MHSNSSANFIQCNNVCILKILDSELQPFNSKPMIKNKLKELLSKLKKFKVQTTFFLAFEKRNHRKIFHSSVKLIATDLDIDEACKSTNQSIITKAIKNMLLKIGMF